MVIAEHAEYSLAQLARRHSVRVISGSSVVVISASSVVVSAVTSMVATTCSKSAPYPVPCANPKVTSPVPSTVKSTVVSSTSAVPEPMYQADVHSWIVPTVAYKQIKLAASSANASKMELERIQRWGKKSLW
jgi:hypothetical protein